MSTYGGTPQPSPNYHLWTNPFEPKAEATGNLQVQPSPTRMPSHRHLALDREVSRCPGEIRLRAARQAGAHVQSAVSEPGTPSD